MRSADHRDYTSGDEQVSLETDKSPHPIGNAHPLELRERQQICLTVKR
ncbi:MAG: hypothetical protein ABI947_26815 [Chloroflexota bacterium]